MTFHSRRQFLAAAAGGACAANLNFLLPLSHAAAAVTAVDPKRVVQRPELSEVMGLIRDTPRERCVPTFIARLRAGLSYQDFLSALFLVAIENGDPHQVAQVYSAHRVSSEARTEERLLPMFWVLDRVKRGQEEQDGPRPPAPPLGTLPNADEAAEVFEDAIARLDPEAAERALIALARTNGPRHALARTFRHSARRVAGTLGHHPIVVANSWRTLETMGWQHAEMVLRYVAGSLAQNDSDRTYQPNLERIAGTRLPAGWAADVTSREATIELYNLLRSGDCDAACDLACAQLASGKVQAGAVWDALHLVAADLVFRYKTGGLPIGGALIHAVTSTNALRYAFDCTADDPSRLILILQGIGALGDVFIRPAQRESQLRDMNLLELRVDAGEAPGDLRALFAMLPHKDNFYVEKDPAERRASDAACRRAFACVSDPANVGAFQQAARSFLCVKASPNPHDIKYPAAAFEDAARVSPEWRPHVLAASVHALHGTASNDAAVLVQAREALG